MRAGFFSLFALAASAIAVPLSQDIAERSVDAIVPVIEAREVTDFLNEKRTIRASADVIASLQGCVKAVGALTASIDVNVKKVGKGKGKISADACAKVSVPHIHSAVKILARVKADLKAAAKLRVTAKADIAIVLKLVIELITNLLVCVKKLAITVSLRAELKAALKLAFSLLGDVLTLSCRIVPGIVSGCVSTLSPLIINAQASIIAPCLGAVFGVSGGLKVGLSASLGIHL